MARRPRVNVTCGKFWISWGPREPPPSTKNDFDILVETSELGNQDPVYKPITATTMSSDDWETVVNGLCAHIAALEIKLGKKPQ